MLGGETSGPLFVRCVMRSGTGTSALSALPVCIMAGKSFPSTNRKSSFISLFFRSWCTMSKRFLNTFGPQLNMFLSVSILVNLLRLKLVKFVWI